MNAYVIELAPPPALEDEIFKVVSCTKRIIHTSKHVFESPPQSKIMYGHIDKAKRLTLQFELIRESGVWYCSDPGVRSVNGRCEDPPMELNRMARTHRGKLGYLSQHFLELICLVSLNFDFLRQIISLNRRVVSLHVLLLSCRKATLGGRRYLVPLLQGTSPCYGGTNTFRRPKVLH